jgi:hypothetical protein
MTVKKVEIKVDINCGKCNSAIMEAVTEIEGNERKKTQEICALKS